MSQRILLLTGMNRDQRVFDRLIPLLPTASIVEWLPPGRSESIAQYAGRLGTTVEADGATVVCGVSFGGIVARELAMRIGASACVIVSSVSCPQELPPWVRRLRFVPPPAAGCCLRAVGRFAQCWPSSRHNAAVRRLAKLSGNSGHWYRWASAAVLQWAPSRDVGLIPLLHIHGDCDATFPVRYANPDFVIAGGGHVLPLTHHLELAAHLLAVAR